MMGEFNAKDANFLWRQIGRIDGVIETLNRTEGEMPEIIAGVLNTKRGKGMQSTYRREKIVRTEKEFDINGTKVMVYSRKDAIKRLKHKK